jgi:hypothetical protein
VNKPVLFCYDGSDGSKTALGAAGELIKPADAVVLVVWTPASVQLARAGSFLVAIPNEGEIDEQERPPRAKSPKRAPRVLAGAATTPRHESRKPMNPWPIRSMRSPKRLTPD